MFNTEFIAPISTIRHNRIHRQLENKGHVMPANEWEWNAEDYPPLGVIYETWLTTAEVVERTDYNSTMSVIHAIKNENNPIRGVKLGDKHRGEWRIDPKTLEGFEKDTRGRKPDDDGETLSVS